jgi:hypothetical protein
MAADEWHEKLAREVAAAASPHETIPVDAAALEIEFGRARSAVTYALELARAHRVPVAGNVAGDDVWMKIGDARARFLLNRRENYVAIAITPQDEVRAQWDAERRALVDANGKVVDLGAAAREAIDGLVAEWRKMPSRPRVPVAPYREDEPTKG